MRKLLLISAATLLASCGGSDDASPVPRRKAYPRPALYDSTYMAVADLPVHLELNTALRPRVEARADGTRWITAEYPAYCATMYVTVTPVDEATVEGVVDNRAERIHLNIGGAGVQVTESDNAHGYHSNIVRTLSATSTPLQFLAVKADTPRWVVSGSVFFGNNTADVSLDSISPVYDALARDVTRAMQSLSDL